MAGHTGTEGWAWRRLGLVPMARPCAAAAAAAALLVAALAQMDRTDFDPSAYSFNYDYDYFFSGGARPAADAAARGPTARPDEPPCRGRRAPSPRG